MRLHGPTDGLTSSLRMARHCLFPIAPYPMYSVTKQHSELVIFIHCHPCGSTVARMLMRPTENESRATKESEKCWVIIIPVPTCFHLAVRCHTTVPRTAVYPSLKLKYIFLFARRMSHQQLCLLFLLFGFARAFYIYTQHTNLFIIHT